MSVNSMFIHAQKQGNEAIDESKSEYVAFCQDIYHRHNVVTLIKQIHHMISAVQLHRGMSMSLLAGNTLFQADIERLQQELENRLAIIEVFVNQTEGILSSHDKEKLQQAWLTIRHDWHDDTLLDNFELQSHFIEQLMAMIGTLAQRLLEPLPNNGTGIEIEVEKVYPSTFRTLELLNFLSPQFIQLIELLAKIRGLSTHAASAGRVEYMQDRKLRYLVQCAKEHNERSRHQAKRLGTLWGNQLSSLSDIATSEMKVLFLFNTVEMDILGGTEIAMESHQLFKLASEIIDTYFKILEDGWDVIRCQLDKDMEAWIRTASIPKTH